MPKLSKLKQNPLNPRSIKGAGLSRLKRDLKELGDVGGILFNRRTGHLVGGNQRARVMKDGEIVLENQYDEPTRTGTVADGFVVHEGERYAYREVDWDEATEKKALIVANVHAGEFDMEILANNYDHGDLIDFGMSPSLLHIDTTPIVEDPEDDDPGSHMEEEAMPGDTAEAKQAREEGVPNVQTGELMFPLAIIVNKVQKLHWEQIMDQLGTKRPSEAFVRLLEVIKKVDLKELQGE